MSQRRSLFLMMWAQLACVSAWALPLLEVESPPGDALVRGSEVLLSGRAEGVVRLLVDGVEVPVVEDRFQAGPYKVQEGTRAFLLHGENAAGEIRELVHRVVRDSRSPRLSVIRPKSGTSLRETSTDLIGTIVDQHLRSLWVGEEEVAVVGGRFRHALELVEGWQELELRAVDTVGNQTVEKLRLRVDLTSPELSLIESTSEQALADGALYAREVRLAAKTSEGELRVLVDGQAWDLDEPIVEQGSHTVEMVAVDEAGNESRRRVSFSIDRSAPRFGSVSAVQGEEKRQVTLRGKVEGATTVEAGGERVSVDGDGRFRLPMTLQEEGLQPVSVVALDRAGNKSTSTLFVKSDTVAPVVTIVSPAEGAVIGGSPITVSGTVVDAELAEVRLGAEVATLSGESFTVSSGGLAEGSSSLTVEAEDVSGNIGTTSVSVILDTTAPVIEIRVDGVLLVDGAVFAGSITPEILATDATTVTLDATLDGAAYVSGTTIETEGAHTLNVTASDAAGNTALPLLLTFHSHQSPPVLVTITPADGTLTAISSVTLSGQIAGAVDLTVAGQAVAGQTVPLLADGDFITDSLALVEGLNVFTVIATAASGLTTTVSHAIVLDGAAPALAVSSPAPSALVSTTAVDVSGTATDAHSLEVVVNGVAGSLSGSAFLATQVPLVEGENVLLIRAEDELGNIRELSRTVHSDTTPPVVTFIDPAVSGVVVPGPTLHVAGTAIDPHFDRVEVNGEAASADGDGSWSAEVPLVEAENSLIARAFDSLGHTSEVILFVERDSSAPEVSITEPIEGWATTASSVDVRGSVADEPGVAVTVNGSSAAVGSGTFEALAVPLVAGENVLIARATDSQGNEGVASLIARRDNEPPTYVVCDPSDGALALGSNAVFVVTFSEELSPPVEAAYRLEVDDGAGGWSPLAASAAVDGSILEVAPDSSLPTQKDLRLVLTGTLADPAGNPLSNPTTLTFATADTSAPGAPQVTAPPPLVCASTVILTGTAEADSRVVVSGGAAPVEGMASAGGSFSLSVELLPGLNALTVSAIDGGGNSSPPSAVEVVHDCQAPTVVDATRVADVFLVVFSEPVAAATLVGSITLSSVDGPIAGSVSLSGTEATFSASAALAAGDLLLEVSTEVSDLAGNTLAYPYTHWFEESLGESFFSGTAIDDATGRPLAGVRVSVIATDGVATSEPRPELTTDAGGRFILATAAGTHDLTFSREGYSPVFRVATTQTGSGTEVFDPRLTPVGAVQAVGAAGAQMTEAGGVELTIPSGALSAAAEISVTAVGEQGLPALLPYGWSPRAAAWIVVDPEQTLSLAATLKLPVPSPDGSQLTVASLDLGTLQWRAVAIELVSGRAITTLLSSTGAYAVLERDEGMALPVASEVLASLPSPSSDLLISATPSFDPELVLPNQRSRATISYQTSVAVASGLPLTLEIREQLELLDGSQRNEAPYRADLVLYRNPAGGSASSFWLQPSEAARSLPVRVGSEVVMIETYIDEGVRGNVLGPSGGTVIDDEGDVFVVPAGALTEPTAVVLHRRTVAELPLPIPRGVTIDGGVELELELSLALPGTLSYLLTPAPTGASGVLLSLVEIGGEQRWRAQAALEATASGWTTAPIAGQNPPWPGVTEAGIYAFARFTEPHGYAWGVMTDVSGAPLVGGLVSSQAVDWVQISDSQGGYVLPLPAAGQTVTLTAENLATGNVSEQLVSFTEDGEQLELGLPLQIVAPSVMALVPGDGEAGVPLGIEPTIDFSEPVDPDTLTAGIELLREGVAQPIQFSVQGTLVRILPASALQPETDYTLTVGLAVQDLQGYSLVSQSSAAFQTAIIVLPESIDPRKLRVIRPDPQTGLAHVEGLADSVPGEVALVVENTSRPVATISVTAAQDGSFSLDIEAQLGDRLQMTVLIVGATAPVLWLPPFLTPDLLSAYVGSRAESLTTGEGITVTLFAGTFDGPTWVRAASESIASAPRPAPDLLPAVTAFSLDFGGAVARKPLQLRIPAPTNVGAGPHLLNRFVEVLGEQGWMMHDILQVDEGNFVSSVASETLSSLNFDSPEKARDPTKAGELPAEEYVTGAVVGGFYEVVQVDGTLGFIVLPLNPLTEILITSTSFGTGTPVIGLVDLFLIPFMPRGLIIPTLLNVEYQLTGVDLTTGYELFSDTIAPSSEPFVELPPDLYGDLEPPVLLGGSPLKLHHLKTAAEGLLDLGPGLTFEVTGNLLLVVGNQGATVKEGKVSLLGLDTGDFQEVIAAEDGSFSILESIERGDRYLLGIQSQFHIRDPIVLEFNEALPIDVAGIEVRNVATQKLVDLTITPRGTRTTWVIEPTNGWPVGEYRLELSSELADVGGNHWVAPFHVTFSLSGSQVGDSLSMSLVQDVASLGSLVFVATLQDGLQVVNASDPTALTNFLPNNLSFKFPFQEATRGVAVDPHGRVFVTGGGTATFGQLKIIDPQAINLVAIETDNSNLDEAFRGSTLLSDPVGGLNTILPAGYPRRLSVMSNDDSEKWVFDPAAPPAGVTFSPSTPQTSPEYLLTVSVSGDFPEREGMPMTLRNQSRGSWYRVDADADGGGSFTVVVEQGSNAGTLSAGLRVRPGDQLELLRNKNAFAYVGIDGVGLAVVDVNAFYGEDVTEDFSDPNIASSILSYHPGYPVPPTVCDPSVPSIVRTPLDVGVLLDVNHEHPLVIPTLIHRYGLGLMEATSLNAPADLEPLWQHCAAINDQAVMGGMEVLQAYPMDLNGDGVVGEGELRDYVVVTNASVDNPTGGEPTGWVMVFDLTNRGNEAPVTGRPNVVVTTEGMGDTEPGDVVTYTITAKNTGDRIATDLVFRNPIPQNTSFVPEGSHSDWVCSPDDKPPSVCSIPVGDLAGGEATVSRSIAFQVDDPLPAGAPFVLNTCESEDLWGTITACTGPKLVGKIQLPKPVSTIAADRKSRRLFVAGFGSGIYVVDFDGAPSLQAADVDQNQLDDRIVETIEINNESVSRLALAPELGLLFAGGQAVGITSVAVTPPQLAVLAADSPISRSVGRVAPFGVPTAPEGNGGDLPGLVRIEARLPGGLADSFGELPVDVLSLGPGGLEIDRAGDPEQIEDLPSTSYAAEDGIPLRRLADRLYEEGFNIFVSDPILLLADLRASVYYDQTEEEEAVCNRCDLVEENVYTTAQLDAGKELYRELLSGHLLAVRFPEAFRTLTGELYASEALDLAQIEVPSVPWDIGPAVSQEPRISPSHGIGDVAPGTLLHSGEFSRSETDFGLRGRGLDFAFTRNYRSQVVGGGPLGPGWDHGYRMRLRELPNGDVEYFDGRGRRELFRLLNQGTGVYSMPEGAFSQLNRHGFGWNIVDPGDTLFRFDRFGRLVSISDSIKTAPEVGTALEFEYDQHSRLERAEAHGRWIRFEYDDDGRLSKVRDFSDREFSYRYDEVHLLEEVETPAIATFEAPNNLLNGPLVTKYTYELAVDATCSDANRCLGEFLNRENNLETLTDPKGQTWLELTYDDKAFDLRPEEVTSQKWGAEVVSINYEDDHPSHRRVTDRRGFERHYFHSVGGQQFIVEDPLESATVLGFNTEGVVTQMTLPTGRILNYTLDSEHWDRRKRGNVLEVSEVPSVNPEELPDAVQKTTIGYGAANKPKSIRDPENGTTLVELSDTGLQTLISRSGVEIRREFNDFGEVSALMNARGNRTEYKYFEEDPKKGLLERIIVDSGGLALETAFDYDPRGNQVEVTNPRGVRHQFVFNELDWLVEQKWAVVTSGGGLDPVGHRLRYSYDRNGNITQVEELFGTSTNSWTRTQIDYGTLNEVLEIRREVTPQGSDWVTERFVYDQNLNVTERHGPEGQLTRFELDERGLIKTQTREIAQGDPDNLQESFVYNQIGQLIMRTDAEGGVWEIRYDGHDRPREWIDPLGQKIRVKYNLNGQTIRTRAFGADGQILAETNQEFDALLRPHITTEMLWQYQPVEPGDEPPTEPPINAIPVIQKTVYDPASNVIEVHDPLGQISYMEYDGAERLKQIVDPLGNITELSLDAAGNPWRLVSREQSPSGEKTVQTTASFDAFDRQTSVTDALDHTSSTFYDLRGNVVRTVDAESNNTSFAYDGLNRRTRSTRPEGIEETFTYDPSSRLVTYRDARSNATTWSYDVLDRLVSMTDPDGTSESYEYDRNGNQTQVTQANGALITQSFDAANRLSTREIEPAEGDSLLGPTAETYAYDGLGRTTIANSGVLTERTYDSLSRLVSDKTNSRSLDYAYDLKGDLLNLTYPSGRQLQLTRDALSRPEAISWLQDPEEDPISKAIYGYRGANLIARREVGQSIVGTFAYDAARRLEEQLYEDTDQSTVFGERASWTPRGLKASQSRSDLNDRSLRFDHDAAGRLLDVERTINLEDLTAYGSVGPSPGQFGFAYDPAQNLKSKSTALSCQDDAVHLPLDGSGRNRPGRIGAVELNWDTTGNLATKDNLTFLYDYRDRLTEVRDGETVVSSYLYDAFDRRIERTVSGVTEETVWSGWQPVETYRDGKLESRRTYGSGLDEVVSFEQDLDADGVLDQEYLPFYDTTGNLVLMSDVDGRPIERYTYSPYGEQGIQVDSTSPRIEQVRIKNGQIAVEMSEEILLDELQKAVASGSVFLTNLTQGANVELQVEQPVNSGRQARRRFVLVPTALGEEFWPAAGEVTELAIPFSALKDLFGNFATPGTPTRSLTWPAGDQIVEDTAEPRLEELCVESGGILRLQFSEELNPAHLAAQVTIDGQAVIWVVSADGYDLRTEQGLEVGNHTLSAGVGPLDLAEHGLVAAFERSFDVVEGGSEIVFSAPYPGFVDSSTISNAYGFHGLPRDSETGLIYVRHRYYDPEMGRFISTDPFGYADGPSQYQFALNNPVDFSDPTGEAAETVWDAASLSIGLASLAFNLAEGNYRYATFDAFGVIVDAAATATPFVPGGVGASLRASRSTGAIRKAQLVDQSLNVGQGFAQAGQSLAQGDYGWAAFYGGMSALGIQQVRANPFELRAVGFGSNGGNSRIVPKSIGPAGDPGGLTIRAGRDILTARTREMLTRRVYPELGQQELEVFDTLTGSFRRVSFEPGSFGSSFRGAKGRYVKQPDLVDLRPVGELQLHRGDFKSILAHMQDEIEIQTISGGVRNASDANNIFDAMFELFRAKARRGGR